MESVEANRSGGAEIAAAPDRQKTIVVIGTGYVGLPAALLLAQAGHAVVGVDINANIVRAINDGVRHINEAALQATMDEPAVLRNLKAQSTPCEADAYLIAVPTPLDERKKVADLSMVVDAVQSIVPFLRAGNLIILESTVPPLTCRKVITPLLEKSGLTVGQDLHLRTAPNASCPAMCSMKSSTTTALSARWTRRRANWPPTCTQHS